MTAPIIDRDSHQSKSAYTRIDLSSLKVDSKWEQYRQADLRDNGVQMSHQLKKRAVFPIVVKKCYLASKFGINRA